jgi:hypothetical protein
MQALQQQLWFKHGRRVWISECKHKIYEEFDWLFCEESQQIALEAAGFKYIHLQLEQKFQPIITKLQFLSHSQVLWWN